MISKTAIDRWSEKQDTKRKSTVIDIITDLISYIKKGVNRIAHESQKYNASTELTKNVKDTFEEKLERARREKSSRPTKREITRGNS